MSILPDLAASPELLLVLFLVALVAGWVDALAGGGGLITVPALLLSGLPPAAALATNKLQGSFGAFSAALYFLRRGMIPLRASLPVALAVAAGSVAGGMLLLRVSAGLLVLLIPALLIGIGVYFLFFARNLDEARPPRIGARTYRHSVAPLLGFYDGFLGPGTGSFMATSLVTLRGLPIRQATAEAKLLNFSSNIAALAYFLVFGQIAWALGGVMIAGQIIGAALGAHTAFRGGARIIRPVTIIVCFAMSARVLARVL